MSVTPEHPRSAIFFLTLAVHSRSAIDLQVLKHHSVDMEDAAYKLANIVPNIISHSFNPSHSHTLINATITDLLSSLKRAQPSIIPISKAQWLEDRKAMTPPLAVGHGVLARCPTQLCDPRDLELAAQVSQGPGGKIIDYKMPTEKRNLYMDALAVYRESLAEDPDNALAHYGIGVVYRKIGRIDEAMESYKHSLDLDPKGKDGAVWNNMGSALSVLGKHHAALEHYSRAMQIDPGNTKFKDDFEAQKRKHAADSTRHDHAKTLQKRADQLRKEAGKIADHGSEGQSPKKQKKETTAPAAEGEQSRSRGISINRSGTLPNMKLAPAPGHQPRQLPELNKDLLSGTPSMIQFASMNTTSMSSSPSRDTEAEVHVSQHKVSLAGSYPGYDHADSK